jgi:hypothetical protein
VATKRAAIVVESVARGLRHGCNCVVGSHLCLACLSAAYNRKMERDERPLVLSPARRLTGRMREPVVEDQNIANAELERFPPGLDIQPIIAKRDERHYTAVIDMREYSVCGDDYVFVRSRLVNDKAMPHQLRIDCGLGNKPLRRTHRSDIVAVCVEISDSRANNRLTIERELYPAEQRWCADQFGPSSIPSARLTLATIRASHLRWAGFRPIDDAQFRHHPE